MAVNDNEEIELDYKFNSNEKINDAPRNLEVLNDDKDMDDRIMGIVKDFDSASQKDNISPKYDINKDEAERLYQRILASEKDFYKAINEEGKLNILKKAKGKTTLNILANIQEGKSKISDYFDNIVYLRSANGDNAGKFKSYADIKASGATLPEYALSFLNDKEEDIYDSIYIRKEFKKNEKIVSPNFDINKDNAKDLMNAIYTVTGIPYNVELEKNLYRPSRTARLRQRLSLIIRGNILLPKFITTAGEVFINKSLNDSEKFDVYLTSLCEEATKLSFKKYKNYVLNNSEYRNLSITDRESSKTELLKRQFFERNETLIQSIITDLTASEILKFMPLMSAINRKSLSDSYQERALSHLSSLNAEDQFIMGYIKNEVLTGTINFVNSAKTISGKDILQAYSHLGLEPRFSETDVKSVLTGEYNYKNANLNFNCIKKNEIKERFINQLDKKAKEVYLNMQANPKYYVENEQNLSKIKGQMADPIKNSSLIKENMINSSLEPFKKDDDYKSPSISKEVSIEDTKSMVAKSKVEEKEIKDNESTKENEDELTDANFFNSDKINISKLAENRREILNDDKSNILDIAKTRYIRPKVISKFTKESETKEAKTSNYEIVDELTDANFINGDKINLIKLAKNRYEIIDENKIDIVGIAKTRYIRPKIIANFSKEIQEDKANMPEDIKIKSGDGIKPMLANATSKVSSVLNKSSNNTLEVKCSEKAESDIKALKPVHQKEISKYDILVTSKNKFQNKTEKEIYDMVLNFFVEENKKILSRTAYKMQNRTVEAKENGNKNLKVYENISNAFNSINTIYGNVYDMSNTKADENAVELVMRMRESNDKVSINKANVIFDVDHLAEEVANSIACDYAKAKTQGKTNEWDTAKSISGFINYWHHNLNNHEFTDSKSVYLRKDFKYKIEESLNEFQQDYKGQMKQIALSDNNERR